MKRVLLIVGGIVLVAVLAIVGTIASAFIGNPEIVDGQELPGGGRLVKEGYVSAALITIDAKSVALVDCGMDPEGKAILGALTQRGLGPEAVKWILLTHGHSDHTGACTLFPQAQLVMGAGDGAITKGEEKSHGALTRWLPTKDAHLKVAQALKGGEVIPLGAAPDAPKAEAFAVPGHTAGSMVYLVSGGLYFGDSADSNKDGGLVGAKRIFTDDPDQNRKSLQTLATTLAPRAGEVQRLVFAHTGSLPGFKPLEDFGKNP